MIQFQQTAESLQRNLKDQALVQLAMSEEPAPISSLTDNELLGLSLIKTSSRQVQWLLGRQALKRLLSGSESSFDTTQIRFPHRNVSLTHTEDLAVAVKLLPLALPAGWELSGTGVDFEYYRPIRAEVARFFLTPKEIECLAAEQTGSDSLLRLWTIKESLFKADPENQDRLIGDYETVDPKKSSGNADCKKNPYIVFTYASVATMFGYLSIAMSMRRSQDAVGK